MSSSKRHSPSYVSSPAWSLNTLTGTSVSGASGGLPVTPVLSPVGLPTPPGSASRSSTSYTYAQFPMTPGAPHMGTVPLPSSQCTPPPLLPLRPAKKTFFYIDVLPTPPVSPERSRYAAVLHELLVYTGHRS